MPGIFAHPILNPFSPRAGTGKYFRRPCASGGTKATLAIVCYFLTARPGRRRREEGRGQWCETDTVRIQLETSG